MVTIRLSRSGAKKKPFYHFTVTDSRKPRDSGYIERLGFFNPFATGQEIRLKIDHERLEYWLSKGAQTSDKVTNLVKESKMTPDQLSKLQEKTGYPDSFIYDFIGKIQNEWHPESCHSIVRNNKKKN